MGRGAEGSGGEGRGGIFIVCLCRYAGTVIGSTGCVNNRRITGN